MSDPIGSLGARQDLLIAQGATYKLPLAISNPDGTPMNLTGCTLRSQVRRKALATGAPLATFAFAITDAVGGKALLQLTDVQTSALPAGEDPAAIDSRSVWDLELVDSLGEVTRLLYGTVTVHREVTRP